MKNNFSTFRVRHRNSDGGTGAGRPAQANRWFIAGCWLILSLATPGPAGAASVNETADADTAASAPAIADMNSRELYNAGTEKLRAGKWDDAESLLESSLSRQDERVQPAALFNLGYARFAQGNEELKKTPPAAATSSRARSAAAAGADAIEKATDALAGNDVQQMVQAYIFGRGARKEMREATKAVQRAMEVYGKTLSKWRRSLGDFQGAAELHPGDTNATHNAEMVAQAIAKLVDSLREMQQAAANLNGEQAQLGGLLSQLKGRIPAPDAPPGANGEDGEDGENGKGPLPESLTGQQESPTNGGQETGLKISPEAAAQLLNGIQPGGKLLPMGQGEAGKPKDRSGRIW